MWQYILQTGKIASPQELLNITLENPMPYEYYHAMHPTEKLEIPKEIESEFSINLWKSIVADLKINRNFPKYENSNENQFKEEKQEKEKIYPEDGIIERPAFKLIHNISSSDLQEFTPNVDAVEQGKFKIAILVASKVDLIVDSAYDLPIVKILLQSLLKSLTKNEKETFLLTFYIGFDSGDKFYDSEENMEKLFLAFNQLEKAYPIKFRAVCTGNTHNAPAHVWSKLGNLAYHEG